MRKVHTACTHLNSVRHATPSGNGCVECLAMGDTWVHLRLCRTCGHVGCCDDSKNRHARKHSAGTGHALISSFEPGEDWSWCFIDEIEVALPPF
jgi:Zn-finger in ubiquitin-hydrolases and other protein